MCRTIPNSLILPQLVIMPHNLRIVDYGLGHPGSVHDAYAFQGTQMGRNPEQVIPPDHWIWADSAYPMQPWCVVPFKATGEGLTRTKNLYNKYLSKVSSNFLVRPKKRPLNTQVRVRVEHVFAALKGRFQSLRELRLQVRTKKDIQVAVHWIQCCIILHNMIIDFEKELGIDSSTGWAREEGQEPNCPPQPVVVDDPAGTPGQQFRTELMRRLFNHLDVLVQN